MTAVTDWTPVLVAGVTGITGILGGGIGFLIARSQAGVERAKIEAENERLRIQHQLDHATQRRTIYREFMAIMYRFAQAGTGARRFETGEAFNEWQSDETEKGTAAQMFGTQGVRDAVSALEDLTSELISGFTLEDIETNPDYVQEVVSPRFDEWWTLYNAVIDAIRTDVAASY